MARWVTARVAGAACVVIAGWHGPDTARADTLVVTPIALQRQTAPVGGRYVLFGDISLDSLRRVTFTASLSRGQVGIFRTRRGQIEPLVITGDPAPPDAGYSFDVPDEAASNAHGDLAFIATTRFPRRTGVFIMRDGAISTVARTGDSAPTADGEIFDGFDQVYLLDTGEIYFGATLASPSPMSLPAGRAIIRTGPSGLEAVIAPGDHYGGTREIEDALQFDVNEGGDVLALARVGDFGPALQGETVGEIVLKSGARLTTLASVNLSISGGSDQVRHLAITFDQIHIDEEGVASFYASTYDFPQGAYFRNAARGLYTNAKILAEGDPSPVSPTDRLMELGAFGFNHAETLVFHASTQERPQGGLFVRRAGLLEPVALVGEPRPDGADVWHGFFRIDLNEGDAFAFTDFEDLFVQVGVFLGHFLDPPDVIIGHLRDFIGSAGVDRAVAANVGALLDVIDRSLTRGDTGTAVRLVEALRLEIGNRTGRSIPEEIAGQIDLLLEDLIAALGGPSTHGPPGSPPGGGPRVIQRRLETSRCLTVPAPDSTMGATFNLLWPVNPEVLWCPD